MSRTQNGRNKMTFTILTILAFVAGWMTNKEFRK